MNKKTKNKYEQLAEPDKQKIQAQFHADELSYLASYSFESGLLTERDLKTLYRKIDKKTKSNNTWLNPLILLICGAFIGCNIVFFYYQNQLAHPTIQSTFVTKIDSVLRETNIKSEQKALGIDETAPVAEEHFQVSETSNNENKYEIFEDAQIKEIMPLEVKTPEFKLEENFTYIPNAPFIYLHNLKVADYAKLYFRNKKGIDTRENGISAAYANKEEINESSSSIFAEQDYYAHEIIKDAMLAFNKKQYSHCIELLDLLLNINKEDVNCLFYKGMCHYYLYQVSEATDYFDQVLKNKVNVFLEEAEFFRALARKRLGATDEAKTALQRIKNQKLFYSERAAEELLLIQQ